MKKITHLPLLLATGFLFVACEKSETITVTIPSPTPVDITRTPPAPTETLETSKLGSEVDRYVANATEENAADVRKAFAELDGEIAELEGRVAKTAGQDRAEAQAKLTNLQTYRAAESARFTAAAVPVPVISSEPVTPIDARTGAEKTGDSLEKAGEEVKDTAEKVGDTIKDGAENLGEQLKDATGN